MYIEKYYPYIFIRYISKTNVFTAIRYAYLISNEFNFIHGFEIIIMST